MATTLTVTLFLFAVLASAQTPERPARSPTMAVYPVTSLPLSLEQIEERTRTLPDGRSDTEVIKWTVYRDSAGRIRTETSMPGPSGESYVSAHIVDPVAGSVVVLLVSEKLAVRNQMPESQAQSYRVATRKERLPKEKWAKGTEDLGTRMIDGIEAFGTRFTPSSEGHTPIFITQESWWSVDLQLKVSETTTRTNGKDVAKIQNLVRGEPDPALFKIPSGYTIQEMPLR